MATTKQIAIEQPGERTAGTLAQSLGIGLPDEERDRLQETLERIDELERLADTKAGLVQLH